jgi:secreted trypsin-like serine protease
MKLILAAIPLLISFSAISKPLIIGGNTDTTNNKNGIFHLAIVDTVESGACTATKISKNFIITAAHCFHGKKVKQLGFSYASKNPEMDFLPLDFEQIYMHPSFEKLSREEVEEDNSSNFKTSDIALLKIKPNPQFDELEIVELDFEVVQTEKSAKIWGYGCQETINDTSNYVPERKFGSSRTLKIKELEVNHNQMADYYSHYAESIFDFNIITAGNKMETSSPSLCLGDSGGPLLINNKLVGINANYTFNDMNPNDPNETGKGISYINLHARISKIKSWIEDTLKL